MTDQQQNLAGGANNYSEQLVPMQADYPELADANANVHVVAQ